MFNVQILGRGAGVARVSSEYLKQTIWVMRDCYHVIIPIRVIWNNGAVINENKQTHDHQSDDRAI